MKINKAKLTKAMITMSLVAGQASVAFASTAGKFPSKVVQAVNNILGGVSVVGVIVAAGMILYAGFKFLTAGAGEKAKAKDMLVPMAVGGILVALAGPIATWVWGLVNTNGQSTVSLQ